MTGRCRSLLGAIALLPLLLATAEARDLSAWNAKYPFDNLGTGTFFEQPEVQAAITTLAGDRYLRWITDLGTASPIEQQDDVLMVMVCKQHDCPARNAGLMISLTGEPIALCLYSSDGDHGAAPNLARWLGPDLDRSVPSDFALGCPNDPSELLAAYAAAIE